MENIISIIKFQKEFPKVYAEFYKSRGNKYSSINEVIDDFLNEIGFGVVLTQVYDKYDIFIGCQSYLRIYPNNKLNMDRADKPIIENYQKYNTFDKARKYTTIYALGFLEEELCYRKLE